MDSPLFVGPASPTPTPSTINDGITLYSWSPTPNGTLHSSPTTSLGRHPRPRWRFRKRFCLLTYSQVGNSFNPDAIMQMLHRDGAYCRIGRERHNDEGIHFHAFVDYKKARDFSSCRHWDIDGVHPNVRPVQTTPSAAYQYAGKDGDIVHDCFPSGYFDNGRDRERIPRGKRLWSTITDAASKDEFFKKCCTLDPRSAACAFGNISRFADWKYGPDKPDYVPYDQTGLATDLSEYPELREYFRTWQGTPGR